MSELILNVEEKRRFERVTSHYRVKYRVVGSTGPQEISQTESISGGGIAMLTPTQISLGIRLELEIFVPALEHVLQSVGEVVRVETVERDNQYLVGLRFTDLPEEGQQELVKYLQLLSIQHLLGVAIKAGASDLHLVVDRPPIYRVDGKLRPFKSPPLGADEVQSIVTSMMNDHQRTTFEQEREIDFSLSYDQYTRFRVNVHVQRGNAEAALRRIDSKIKTLEDLGLPEVIRELTLKPSGLVLITGGTGNGKTTTMASMVDLINRERERMILCLEDPVEYVHEYKRSVVKQREIGSDTYSFKIALKEALRQDPDVIVVGEMRDAETISTAMTAAETGQLVIATIPAPGTIHVIDRIIDIFPSEQQSQIRFQLSTVLQGIIFQVLLPRADGKGRVVATEVMIATMAIRNMIRDRHTEQIHSMLQAGQQHGMHTLDMSLKRLYQKQLIRREIAIENCQYPEFLDV